MSRTYDSDDAKTNVSELISAVIDDEASKSEVRHIIEKIGDDSEIRNKVKRYSLIGDVLRHQQVKYSLLDISGKVRSEIKKSHSASLSRGDSLISRLNVVNLWSKKWNYAINYIALASVVVIVVVMVGRIELNERGRLGVWNMNNHSKQEIAPENVDYNVERSGVSQYTLNVNDNVRGVLAGVNSLQSNDEDSIQDMDQDSEAEAVVQSRFYSYMIQHAGLLTVAGQCGWLSLARFSAVSSH